MKASCRPGTAKGDSIRDEIDVGEINVAGMYAMNDHIILEKDANHQADCWYSQFNADPDNFSLMGDEIWYPVHTYSSSYYQIYNDALVDVRLFIRGYYGPVCYDLRKKSNASTGIRGPETKRHRPQSFPVCNNAIVCVFTVWQISRLSDVVPPES